MKKVLRWLNYSAVVIPFAVEKFLLEPGHFIHQAKQRFLGYQAVRQRKFSPFDIFGSNKSFEGKSLYSLVETGNYEEFESAYSKLPLVKKFLHSHKLFLVRTKRKQFDFKIQKGLDRVVCGRELAFCTMSTTRRPIHSLGTLYEQQRWLTLSEEK